MGEHIVCGVDAHDATLDCRIGVDREASQRRRLENTGEGHRELLEHLGLLPQAHGGAKVLVGYEASPVGFGLYDDCTDDGIECVILAPTKIARSVGDRKRKSDDRDATRIYEALRGHVLAGNELPAIWIPDEQTRDDRETLQARVHTDREEAQVYHRMVERNPQRKKIAVVGRMRRLAIPMWHVGLEAQRRAGCLVTEVPAELDAGAAVSGS